MNNPWYTASQRDILKKEQDFSRQIQGYSPLGNLYQINYANNAAKNSKGRIFLQSKNFWYVISKRNYEDSSLQSVSFEKDYLMIYRPQCKLVIFFFGHIHELTLLKQHLTQWLNQRESFIGDQDYGKYDFVIRTIAHYNAERLSKTGLPTAITTVLACPDFFKNQKDLYTVLRSNNKRQSYEFMVEGDYTNEEAQIVIKKLYDAKVLEVNEKDLDEQKKPVVPISYIHIKDTENINSESEFIRKNPLWAHILEDHEVLLFTKDLTKSKKLTKEDIIKQD